MKKKLILASIALFVASFISTGDLVGQGIIKPWAGTINQSMGGAGTAAPLDAITATYWNPASMADMQQSELSTSVEMIFPFIETDSSITGLGSGSSRAEPGVLPLPFIGWVQKLPDPRMTFGLGVVAAAGIKTNYAASSTNPIFLPQSNSPGAPGGLGQLFTEAQYLEILPSVSYSLTDQLAIGFGPTVTLGQVVVDPFLFGAPDDADGSGQPRYPSARGAKFQWGGGAQFSIFYKATPTVNFGGLIKSPQWMEPLDNFGTDENGLPRIASTKFDLPMVLSLGTAYSGIQNTVLAMDARFVDHKNADGWGPSGFNPDGSLAGLGYGSSFGVMTGIQHRFNEIFTVRGGYGYQSRTLGNDEATIGIAAPLFFQHHVSSGASIALTPCSSLNFAYLYAFENELNGPILTPLGPVPNSNVSTRIAVQSGSFGITVRY